MCRCGSEVGFGTQASQNISVFDLRAVTITRQVSAAEGETLANEIGASWVETSAKLNANVGTYF